MTTTPPGDDTVDSPEDAAVTDEEVDEVLQEIERKRSLQGAAAVVVAIVGITFSVFQMWLAAKGFVLSVDLPGLGTVQFAALQLLQINAVHVAFGLVLTFLLYPTSTGDGPLSGRAVALAAWLDDRLGADHPVTRTVRAVGGALAWVFVDPDFDRVTPLDVVLMGISVLAAAYFITDFQEIQRMRALGLESGRPIQGVFTFLEPIAGLLGPLADTSYAFVLGVVGVLLVLEATRRAISLYLMVIVAAFVVYARFGFLIPQNTAYVGVLSIPPLAWDSIIQNLWYNTENGVFGIPVTVSVQFIYIFILFGAFLEMSGAGQWFIDLAYGATGTRRGGPAKASILASGFMGTISGSSIANTVTTGAFTIPLMKRSGYRPEFAGGVEASASSGGQILPPVMGAAAFLIVQYTVTPFRDVIIAATIPAIVFFFGIWVMVHFEATKRNIGGLDPSELVDIRQHLTTGWFYLVPIGLLLYYLIIERLSVARSAWFTLIAIGALVALVAAYSDETRGRLVAIFGALFVANFVAQLLAGVGFLGALLGDGTGGQSAQAAFAATVGGLGGMAIVAGVLTLATRPALDSPILSFDDAVDDAAQTTADALGRSELASNGVYRLTVFLGKSMESGARTAVPVVIAVAAAGIIPGVISVSGLGPNLVALIRAVAGGSLVLLLLVTAVASIILGMGMPTTVTYIILVSLLAPALVGFGVPELAAHLFILYFGVIADITPPVAVAAYAASGVAKSDAFQTGIEAFSLSLNKAIVPFAFVLAPGIVLLRRKANADELPLGEQYRVVQLTDFLDPGFAIFEVFIPVAGVFVGVVALAATVIGYVSAPVSRSQRGAFAVSSLLLMAPGLAVSGLYDLLGLIGVGVGGGEVSLVVDIGLRAVGLVLFVALMLENRRRGEAVAESAAGAEPA
ncbi:TRAP transporter permease [Haloarcula pellucida]|uniref:C4-dicarboxylate ABC transporter permease n=1 Tax=Haloarcula pellucida TaxID=1427151 RepID=A0A830GR45_9EURY|nr:TRAP transporter fused permease subunit [Halomicroarcula pellucida]MBX0349341.1 TRAP transporter fused permease subunit [Halomicroarcula pellucida]GGO03424.1 C4-dicarboxylate ABC transporter permease [Halomicroarcula pellucida]